MRTRILTIGVTAMSAMIAGTTSGAAAQANDFDWAGQLRAGQTLEIRGANGHIRAESSPDGRVHVVADKRARRSDPAAVRVEVVEHAGGVTICSVYPTPADASRPNECRPGGGRSSTNRSDVQVDFYVRVPAGVHFSGHTANGNIEANGLSSDVRAETVNGDVRIRTAGFAQATTVNGSIVSRLGRSSFVQDVAFETVNGSITVETPDGLDADFRATTVNGSIDSDFQILVTGKISRRSVEGTIGGGGPQLRLSTVNGSIRLRKI